MHQQQQDGPSTKVIQQELLGTMKELSKNFNELKTHIMPNGVNQTVHLGSQCENCKITHIIGTRYKCFVCQNYNLCEKCEIYSNVIHPENHCFLKLKKIETMQEIIANNIPCTISEIQTRCKLNH